MNQQKKSLRVGLTAIAAATVLRFFSFSYLEPLVDTLTQPEVVAFLIYMETGLDVRHPPGEPAEGPSITASFPEPELAYAPESPPPVPPPLPHFTDASALELTYLCACRPDIGSLLAKPLVWDLQSGAPAVLIYHTHTTESYEKGQLDYPETAPYRTVDPRYNMLSIGDRVAELLEQAGIVTIHDREFHDYPNYNGCYGRARTCTAGYLEQYPSLQLVLDLHRDASDGSGGQLRTRAEVDGRDSAQLMLVLGTGAGGAAHRHWEENLSLGLKLQTQLEAQCPGIVRPLSLRAQRFNQDLCPGSLLIEVGAAGNSHEEAMLAAEQLAQAIIALSRGTGPREPPSGL